MKYALKGHVEEILSLERRSQGYNADIYPLYREFDAKSDKQAQRRSKVMIKQSQETNSCQGGHINATLVQVWVVCSFEFANNKSKIRVKRKSQSKKKL